MDNSFYQPQAINFEEHRSTPQRISTRIKSEAPLDTQIRSAVPHNHDHQRRIRALHGLVSHSFSIGDILDDFHPPDRILARTVKIEPTVEVYLDPVTPIMALRNTPKSEYDSSQERPMRSKKSRVVDLTTSEDGSVDITHPLSVPQRDGTSEISHNTSRHTSNEASSRHSTRRQPISSPSELLPNEEQIQLMDKLEIPSSHLTEIQIAYQNSGQNLPAHVKTWLALKTFARQHPIALLAPENIRHAQRILYKRMKKTPPAISITSVVRNTRSSRPATSPYDHVESQPPMSKIARLKEEDTDVIETLALRRNSRSHGVLLEPHRLRSNRRIARRNSVVVDPPVIIIDEATNENTAPLVTDLQIQRLMEPLDTYPKMLPFDAPEDHPHLVQIWDPALINLSRDKHDHLNLLDTVVSIIYKYDAETRNTIKAFLDVEKVKHFFFLFKSRTNKYHSWSIEREGDIVTIGIERNQRALNAPTAESPSAGQYDLTLRYQLLPYPSPGVPSEDNKEDEVVPAHWTLIGASIFPSQPSISEFLYTYPPNRGADSHESYNHPPPRTTATNQQQRNTLTTANQSSTTTSQIPNGRLSILARYFQTTAFTALAIEAEFQVCWGHRVRYDAVLGRVRAAFTNALRGAATQARKREAGEYNRPVPANAPSSGVGSEKSGGGSGGGTKRKVGGREGEGEAEGERAVGASSDRVDGGEGNGRDEEGVEKARKSKRTKRGKRTSGDGSNSEYVASG